MSSRQIEEFTKDNSHWGSNNQQVLNNFILYMDLCQDPIHVYKYMEEKSICTFLPQYWLKKADYYYEIGEYQNCFLCLEEAKFRQDDQHSSNALPQIDIKQKVMQYKDKMQSSMKKFPLKGKRTVEQFVALSNQKGSGRDQENRQEALMNIYKAKYGPLKSQQKKISMKTKEALPKSWMFDIYNDQQEREKQIQSKINEQAKFIETPNMRSRGSKKICKTVDSVQLLKKKNTIQKSLVLADQQQKNKQPEQSKKIEENFFCPLTQIKRKVSFDTTFTKINQVKSNIDRPKIIKFASINIPNEPQKGKQKQMPSPIID